jgi:hypothetical protein
VVDIVENVKRDVIILGHIDIEQHSDLEKHDEAAKILEGGCEDLYALKVYFCYAPLEKLNNLLLH